MRFTSDLLNSLRAASSFLTFACFSCSTSAAFCPVMPYDGYNSAVMMWCSPCNCSWQWSSECCSLDKGFIITDMVSFYLRWYTIYVVEVTLEFSVQKESWILFKEKGIKLSEERKEMGREGEWSKEEEEREREEGQQRARKEEVCLQTIWTRSPIRDTLSQQAPHHSARSLSFFSRSCVN